MAECQFIEKKKNILNNMFCKKKQSKDVKTHEDFV